MTEDAQRLVDALGPALTPVAQADGLADDLVSGRGSWRGHEGGLPGRAQA